MEFDIIHFSYSSIYSTINEIRCVLLESYLSWCKTSNNMSVMRTVPGHHYFWDATIHEGKDIEVSIRQHTSAYVSIRQAHQLRRSCVCVCVCVWRAHPRGDESRWCGGDRGVTQCSGGVTWTVTSPPQPKTWPPSSCVSDTHQSLIPYRTVFIKGCRSGERPKAKAGGESFTHTKEKCISANSING